jgi:hypothetical protein
MTVSLIFGNLCIAKADCCQAVAAAADKFLRVQKCNGKVVSGPAEGLRSQRTPSLEFPNPPSPGLLRREIVLR